MIDIILDFETISSLEMDLDWILK